MLNGGLGIDFKKIGGDLAKRGEKEIISQTKKAVEKKINQILPKETPKPEPKTITIIEKVKDNKEIVITILVALSAFGLIAYGVKKYMGKKK